MYEDVVFHRSWIEYYIAGKVNESNILTSNVLLHITQKWRASLPSKLKIDYRLFVGMPLADRLSFFLVYQNLLILGDFLVDSLVGCYT